ncbi:MAG: squalene/phytoene synthase family protein [Leptolyngbyaceae cyanobacterium MO_188.B28]|nr:squalene/phytoene synthase family protein [Leptolyngbyaceae cyanobacterium MO_188.B28]
MDCQSFSLTQSIALCRQIVAKYDRTFYLGSLLMPLPKRQAMWAIYAWFRQKDEFIDGIEAQTIKQMMLNRWFDQMEALFSSGSPATPTDIALIETIQRYHLPMEPFRDMLMGQRMDLESHRYQTWEDLRLYCYRVAGAVGLASAPIIGSVTGEDATEALVTLGIAMQLTNILQDIGGDARRGRIYLPLEDLKHFNYSEQDLFKSVIDQRWIALMDYEIQRGRYLYVQAEQGIASLQRNVLWPMWVALILYRQDLRAIERNHYQVFGDRPHVPSWWKAEALLMAWWKSFN